MMEIVFAPDWREGVPYQRLLADALSAHGVRVTFLDGYRRVFPLRRLLSYLKEKIRLAMDILYEEAKRSFRSEVGA